MIDALEKAHHCYFGVRLIAFRKSQSNLVSS